MKFLDEFRSPAAARELLRQICEEVTQPWVLMEVCGGQTHSLLRHGIDAELQGRVELIHGPGCPVCVTPLEAIDRAQELSLRDNVVVASFGDMLRVPGSRGSLLDARARGGSVRVCYSPLDAVEWAAQHPDQQVVFFAVGFETTAPATALAVQQARRRGLENFSLLVSHVRVQPAMELLAADPASRVQGFLAAGHVCTVAGYRSYHDFVQRFRLPVVVAGFEPVDLLGGILQCVRQLESGRTEVENQYLRNVRESGNEAARELLEEVYEICDQAWRGLGVVPRGGVRLRGSWREFDAESKLPATAPGPDGQEGHSGGHPECRLAEVLSGRLRPDQCEAFGAACTPETPLGAPMVSDEGACAAYYRYRRKA